MKPHQHNTTMFYQLQIVNIVKQTDFKTLRPKTFRSCTFLKKLKFRSSEYCVCIYSNAHTTPVRIYGEPYAHKFCAVDNFWNITRRQVISPIATFHHVLGRGFVIPRFDFYQMSPSQAESTILHESIILQISKHVHSLHHL